MMHCVNFRFVPIDQYFGADWTGNLAVGTDYDWKYEAVSNDNFKIINVKTVYKPAIISSRITP